MVINDAKFVWSLQRFGSGVSVAIGRVEWRVVMGVVFELCSGLLFLLLSSINFFISRGVAMLLSEVEISSKSCS